MPTEVRLAVAGSGKTAEIASKITAQNVGTASLALTFTRYAQAEIESRLIPRPVGEHETMGWYSFLTQHIVRPYLPKVFPGIIPRGLCFVDSEQQIPRQSGWRYYFNDAQQPYNLRLALLAKKVLEKTHGAPITRLEKIYDNVYIDEFQDLGGNDLVVLEALMKSNINLLLLGDVRQAILDTARSDRLHKEYRGVKLVDWFRKQEAAGNCTIVPNETTTRFNQRIADFSDLVHDPALLLPRTVSKQLEETGHDGIFLVDESHASDYASSHTLSPTVLWSRKSNRVIPEGELMTFGTAKGITRDRVIIMTTKPIDDLLKDRKPLAARSACGFYVAVTRAKYSVALVVKGAKKIHSSLHEDFAQKVILWEPGRQQDSAQPEWP